MTSHSKEKPCTIEARRQTKRGRFYEVEGKLFPSVTTILSAINKPALVNWAAKVEREMVAEIATKLYLEMHGQPKMGEEAWKMYLLSRVGETKASQKELAKASEIGTQAHGLIEREINYRMGIPVKDKEKVPEAAEWAFMAWEDWAKSVHLEPIASEQVIWSREFQYAGTLDLLAKVNGKLAVIDWKTGKSVYSEAHLQNAAYRHAIREMGHGDPEEGYIIRLPKVLDDPKFEAVPADAEQQCFEVFLHTQSLWLWTEAKQSAWEATK